MEKKFITAQELLEDSFRLGRKILESGFRPSFIVGIWRGGTPVGIAVQEFLEFHGIPTDHIAIRTSAYLKPGQPPLKKVRVHGLGYLISKANADDGLIIVDDVYDTGSSVQAVLQRLRLRARRNAPEQIRVATIYFKPSHNQTGQAPDFYIHETDHWLVFPHEINGLTAAEIRQGKAGMAEMILAPGRS
jgi:hypothetical protein